MLTCTQTSAIPIRSTTMDRVNNYTTLDESGISVCWNDYFSSADRLPTCIRCVVSVLSHTTRAPFAAVSKSMYLQ